MIPVSEAQSLLLDLVEPLNAELVPIPEAAGRVLAQDVTAGRSQPPFASSSMDGYAMNAAELELHAMFKVIGESAAGHRFEGHVGAGQAVRIFTGAPMPEGADFVVIQENVTRNGDLITITDEPGRKSNVRVAGVDFEEGHVVPAPQVLTPEHIALLAAMNISQVPVARKPVVSLISTGDELVMPGDTPGPDQIIASNTLGLKAMLEQAGAHVRVLPIARDTEDSLRTAFDLARGADLVITIGGASVGDHDLVGQVSQSLGMERSFYKVLMRPGKPLMAGRMAGSAMAGLPGNPVSAMICGKIFILPMLRKMLGLADLFPPLLTARLAHDIAENGPREHYIRATVQSGDLDATADQDSSLLSVLAGSNALLVRPVADEARAAGDEVSYLPL
jgi:molybdopterin molybdotransferase